MMVARGRPKSPKTLLNEAVKNGDNLALLKAQRELMIQDIFACEVGSPDRIRAMGVLRSLTSDIIKLEGLNRAEEEVDATMVGFEELLNAGISGVSFGDSDES